MYHVLMRHCALLTKDFCADLNTSHLQSIVLALNYLMLLSMLMPLDEKQKLINKFTYAKVLICKITWMILLVLEKLNMKSFAGTIKYLLRILEQIKIRTIIHK
uniref:Uncharacterized protein n=1 Tax=Glossina austeni TaxID=7395 RepID=A0A1A9UI56_GLOAU